jgi:hypothetical protein
MACHLPLRQSIYTFLSPAPALLDTYAPEGDRVKRHRALRMEIYLETLSLILLMLPLENTESCHRERAPFVTPDDQEAPFTSFNLTNRVKPRVIEVQCPFLNVTQPEKLGTLATRFFSRRETMG